MPKSFMSAGDPTANISIPIALWFIDLIDGSHAKCPLPACHAVLFSGTSRYTVPSRAIK